MSQKGHECCCDGKTCEMSVCRFCGNPGAAVTRITLESQVKTERRSLLTSVEGFSFCRSSDCPVVYFNNDTGEYIEKEDMKVRVGIKETEDPAPLCYCFGWTKKKIDEDIARTGTSAAVQDILDKMKTAGCNCERNNPSGGCCLKDVTDYVAAALRNIVKK